VGNGSNRAVSHSCRLSGMALILLAAACVTDVNPDPVTLWEANLAGGEEHALVSGSVAAISRASSTRAGVSVEGLEEGAYFWRIVEGDCGAPGPVLGADAQYPELVVEDGSAAASLETVVSGATMRSGRSYHADVKDGDNDERIACGNFAQRG